MCDTVVSSLLTRIWDLYSGFIDSVAGMPVMECLMKPAEQTTYSHSIFDIARGWFLLLQQCSKWFYVRSMCFCNCDVVVSWKLSFFSYYLKFLLFNPSLVFSYFIFFPCPFSLWKMLVSGLCSCRVCRLYQHVTDYCLSYFKASKFDHIYSSTCISSRFCSTLPTCPKNENILIFSIISVIILSKR